MKLLLAITLSLAISSISNQQIATQQLINIINTNALQLQALGTLTLNNFTYTQLCLIVGSVFGAMQMTVIPSYSSRFSYLQNNANRLFNEMNRLSEQVIYNYTHIYDKINQVGLAANNQTASLTNNLFEFNQNFPAKLINSLTTLGAINASLNALDVPLNLLRVNIQNNQTVLDDALSRQNGIEEYLANPSTPLTKLFTVSINSGTAFISTTLPYCKKLEYTFATPLMNPAKTQAYLNPTGAANGGYNANELIVISFTATMGTFWICDRDTNGTQLNLVDGTLFIVAY